MRSNMLSNIIKTTAIATALLVTGAASAADVYLRAEPFTKNIPDGLGGFIPVQMWGYVQCDSSWACGSAGGFADIDAPGPQLNLTAGDSLTIHLQNALPIDASVMIPGQAGGGSPVAMPSDPRRARSLPQQTLPTPTNTYSWSSLRSGTYLYQSGTAPSLQVPMGLYGALVVTEVGGDPYPGVSADSEAVLLFSEIDPVQNQRVNNAASGGTPPTQACVSIADYAESMTNGYPCTVDYYPALTLVNGQSVATTPAVTPGDTVVLRLANAGQRLHVPSLVGVDLALVAEDGFPYPGMPRVRSEAMLQPGKTLDALVVTAPAVDVTLNVFDRAPTYVNENNPTGGLMAGVVIGAGSPPPPVATIYAVNDMYAVPEDAAPYSAASVLANDVGLTAPAASLNTGPSNGTISCPTSTDPICADGTFDYTPDTDFSGTDTFTYTATDISGSYQAQVNLDVSFDNDGPVANNDEYANTFESTIAIDAAHGVLGNDSDPDGDPLVAAVSGTPPAGLTLNADGSFELTGGPLSGVVTFDYTASDGASTSAPATVTLNFSPSPHIALNVHEPGPAPVAVTSYRWIVQEDATFDINPAAPPALTDTLSTNFHKSFMPVVAQGCVGGECNTGNPVIPVAGFDTVVLDPAKRYYVSVLPNDVSPEGGHTIGGAQIDAGATGPIDIIVNAEPVPTAQISVIVFRDDSPTNGVPDPGEPGLGGFEIQLEDAAGRYGLSPGIVQQDVDGNPLRNSLDCFAGAPPPPAGVILTCPDGTALIENLPPGKYGVFATAPAGTGQWTQTSTIEGTKIQDTWVKAGEPPFLVEFGAPGYHAFIGFVKPDDIGPAGGSHTITGNVSMIHSARAPDITGYSTGPNSYDIPLPHTRAWVGLNSAAGIGDNIATVHAEPDGSFTMSGIPDGTHQLVIWDDYLDTIIFYETVIVAGGNVDVGEIPVPTWFGRHEHNVYLDDGCGGGPGDPGYGDAERQPCEVGLPEQNVNLRFRDGTINQAFPTDVDGFVPFDQVFPFGAWEVAEIDFARFKSTGVKIWVDGGGPVNGGPFPGLMSPQAGSPRVEVAASADEPVLLEGFQSMPGMTSIFEWGKVPYSVGENGGISGIVFHGVTRGENDPRLTVGDTWEPGIPGVTVRLYREVAAMDRDNAPTGNFPSDEDFDFNDNGILDVGTSLVYVDEVQTDSWDDSLPTGCPGENPADPFVTDTLAGDATRCFDGIRNWEQVRDGALFDGGFAFTGLRPGAYVVEVVPPAGYEVIKEEDKNVDFGDTFAMAPVPLMMASAMLVSLPDAAMVAATQDKQWGLAAPPCVGPLHTVPDTLSLFPGEVDTWAPFAGADRPLCNRKRVVLDDAANAATDFHLFTATPVSGQAFGLSTDDIAIEPDPRSPQFGDKWGPPFMPITLRDYKGAIIYQTHTDAFGRYNGLVPSTYSANLPIPSGYSPAMHSVCLNDPIRLDGSLDPNHLPNYGTFCYTLMYMPGTTTYLDTPLLPQAAFAAGFNPVDCALPDGSPVVMQVNGTGTGPVVATGGTLTITSLGMSAVPNPDYEGPLATPPQNQSTVTRNYGFGSSGRVTLGDTALTVGAGGWTNDTITATLPPSVAAGKYELVVTSASGRRSINTVTVTVGDTPDATVPAGGSIQAAIDAAAPGDLILVEPGVYNELVVMWKPVRLQGSGASTVINAVKVPPEKLQAWLSTVQSHLGDIDLLPGQPDQLDLVGPGLLSFEWGGGITVLAANDGSFSGNPSRIDGFTITGADGGGGIFVNGYAHNLEISNNNITGNSGVRHGGIRVGYPYLGPEGDGPFGYNTNVNIHHNSITLNGSQADDAVAGGVAICTGADNYTVAYNYICGNFSLGDAGGIGHLGYSDNGTIAYNQVLFNQNFNQGLNKNGGGVFIGGEPPIGGATLTLGAGDVRLDANLIQGNNAGSGNGAGLRTQFYNGRDVELNPGSPSQWHRLRATNNVIVNNVAAGWGGGASFQDTARVEFILNTVANNDSTGTSGGIAGGPAVPAGIAVEPYSVDLNAAIPGDAENFSVIQLTHNIIWHNRAFTFDDSTGTARLLPVLAPAAVGGCPLGANYLDLGVIGGGSLNPVRNILTSTAGYPASAQNQATDPQFVNAYCNTSRSLSTVAPIQVNVEPEEGNNAISVRYGPLTQSWPVGSAPWNYHIQSSSPARDAPGGGINQPTGANVSHDVDGQVRPQGPRVDLGGDEWWPALRLISATAPASVNGTTVNFGNITGNGTVTSTITVSNYGLATITIASSVVTDDGGPVDYTKTADTCSGMTLVRGATCTVNVQFNYSGGNTKTGALTFTHDGNGSPQVFGLTGQ